MVFWVVVIMFRWFGGGVMLMLCFLFLMIGLVVGLVMGDVLKVMIVIVVL